MLTTHTQFKTWASVLDAAARQPAVPLYYHAPLDHTPRRVVVVKIFKNGKLRINACGSTCTIDSGHLARLSHTGTL